MDSKYRLIDRMNIKIRTLSVTLLLYLLILPLNVTASTDKPATDFKLPPPSVTEITTNPEPHRNPRVYKNYVVFDDYISGFWQVSLYNINSHKTIKISDACLSLQHLPRIYENLVVYIDQCSGSGNQDVYLYNINTKKTKKITSADGLHQSPDIYKNMVVYMFNPHNAGTNQIYMYNVNTNKETQVTNDKNDHLYPAIYGDKIVDQENFPGNVTKIFLLDLKNKTHNQISFDTGNQANPRINGNSVTWEDYQNVPNHINHIFTYDIATQHEQLISDPNSYSSTPDIYGSKVVYENNGGQQILMYDSISGNTTILVNGTTTQFFPSIYAGTVVWVGVDPNSGFHEIYMYH